MMGSHMLRSLTQPQFLHQERGRRAACGRSGLGGLHSRVS